MVDLRLYDPTDHVQDECLRYCFMDIVRKELNSVAVEWNQHIISRSINGGPSGQPDTMYFLPHLYDAENYLENVDLAEIESIYQDVTSSPKDYQVSSKNLQNFSYKKCKL